MQPNGEPPAEGERPLDEERRADTSATRKTGGTGEASPPPEQPSSAGSEKRTPRTSAPAGTHADSEPEPEPEPEPDSAPEPGASGAGAGEGGESRTAEPVTGGSDAEQAAAPAEEERSRVTWGVRPAPDEERVERPAAMSEPGERPEPGDVPGEHMGSEQEAEETGQIPASETTPAEPPVPAAPPPPARDAAGNLVLRTGSAAVLIGVTALAAAFVLIHLGMVFLHVAPSNTVSNKHASAIDGYIYPEFEQNWKLFAPNPLQQNVAVHVRVETRTEDGNLTRGEWINLTEFDAENIRGEPFPSHAAQNQLRRAWDFYASSHDSDNKPTGTRSELSQAYIKRIAMLRLGEELGMDTRSVQRLQFRSAVTPVQPPPWANEKSDNETKYRTLPWWTVTSTDVPEAAR